MSTVSAERIMDWQAEATVLRSAVAAKRQALRADPASGDDDPMRTGLDAVFDSLSTTLTLLGHLWVLADIQE